jgi:hypothetical protein
MKKILTVVGLIVFQVSVLSAATVSLSGTVKDAGGAGIAGVELSLVNLGDITGVTDAQGSFTWPEQVSTGQTGSELLHKP